MRITRRRKRRPDLFASPEWVRSIFDHLKAAFPLLSSLKDKDLVKLARSIRHVERYSATDTRRGRPSRWPREDIVKIGSKLGEILARETQGRISVAIFVDHYLGILDFPSDLLESLSKAEVNLFEAEQLAKVSASRLDVSQAEARRKRAGILSAHLKSRSSGARLRRRVNEMLASPRPEGIPSAPCGATEGYSDLEDFDPYDSTHLFWEEIKQLGFTFRGIRREDLNDELLEELLKAAEPIWRILSKDKGPPEQE
ncbi:MAG: hypothetical protein ACLGJB_19560 [Blastocatellia bacterium]